MRAERGRAPGSGCELGTFDEGRDAFHSPPDDFGAPGRVAQGGVAHQGVRSPGPVATGPQDLREGVRPGVVGGGPVSHYQVGVKVKQHAGADFTGVAEGVVPVPDEVGGQGLNEPPEVDLGAADAVPGGQVGHQVVDDGDVAGVGVDEQQPAQAPADEAAGNIRQVGSEGEGRDGEGAGELGKGPGVPDGDDGRDQAAGLLPHQPGDGLGDEGVRTEGQVGAVAFNRAGGDDSQVGPAAGGVEVGPGHKPDLGHDSHLHGLTFSKVAPEPLLQYTHPESSDRRLGVFNPVSGGPGMRESLHNSNFLSRREFLQALGLGTAAVLAGACKSGEPATSKTGGTLTYAAKSDAFTLNPLMHTDTTTHTILGQIFEPPLTMGRNGKFVGVLAEDWQLVNDTTVRLVLRRNVKFHNGEELTAEAVKASLDFVLDPTVNSPARPTFDPVVGAEIIDSYTVDIKLRQPYAAYTTVLSFLWLIPPKYFREVGPDGFGRQPIGTGPFKFVEWQKDVRLVVEANPDYWAGRPAIDRVVYRPIPEDSARIAGLQTGEVDLAFAIPVDRVADIESGRGLRVAHRPGQMIYIGLDTLKFEPFKDRRVRQALNYAIDVEGIVKNLFGGRAVRLNGPFFPVTPGYDPSIPPYSYDPARARSLLAEAGYPEGFEVRLDTPVGIQAAQRLKEVAEVVAENLKQVKISVKIQILEPAAAFDKYRAREFQMYIFPWASSPESGRHLHTLFHSKTRGYYYQNTEADRLLDIYMSTLDTAQRAAIGRQLLLFLREDAPWVFMYVEPDIYGIRDRVDWEPNQYDFRFQAYEAKLRA